MTDYNEPKRKRVQVILDESQIDLLKKLAGLNGSSLSHVLRVVIDKQRGDLDKAIRATRLADAQGDWIK